MNWLLIWLMMRHRKPPLRATAVVGVLLIIASSCCALSEIERSGRCLATTQEHQATDAQQRQRARLGDGEEFGGNDV